MRLSPNVLNAVAAVLLLVVIALWGYAFVFEPLMAGKWLTVILFVAACLFWIALKEAARRKAESIDYRRR
jgi:uncharacterized membrane protein